MSHTHDHRVTDHGPAFRAGIVLNLGFVVAELFFGLAAHSLTLVADAGHNAGDVVGLALAWGAALLATRRPTAQRTYGFGRTSILAALANAVLLLVTVGAIAVEALQRLAAPSEVQTGTVILLGAIGILVNGGTAFLFMRGVKADLNIRGAFQHMAADAALAVGVVAAGLVMRFAHWWWLDPAVSLGLALVILASTWGLLCDALNLALDAVSEGLDVAQIREYLASRTGVNGVHDLHVWSLSTTRTALTAHLVAPRRTGDDRWLSQIVADLHERFSIEHATLQVEAGDPGQPCLLQPETVI